MTALSNVALSDTYLTWMNRVNQLVGKTNEMETIDVSIFAKANTVNLQSIGAFVQANTANFRAIGAFTQANTVNLQSIGAFAKANTAGDVPGIVANGAFLQANNANFRAIGAFTKANTAGDTAGIIANAAFGKANTGSDSAGYRANGAFVTANAAFAKANSVTTIGPSVLVLKQDDTSEGGELQWEGAGSHTDWTTDVYNEAFRVYNSAAGTTTFDLFSTGGGTVAMTLNTKAVKTAGRETIWIPSLAMIPCITNGPYSGQIQTSIYLNQIKTLDFDPVTQELAEFAIRMPESWNEGTITFRAVWSHAATSVNFGVVWAIDAVAFSDADGIDVPFGAAQGTGDTGGNPNTIYIGGESAAITIAGSISPQDLVAFRVWRSPSDGSDTLAVDARLHGITLYFTTNAATD